MSSTKNGSLRFYARIAQDVVQGSGHAQMANLARVRVYRGACGGSTLPAQESKERVSSKTPCFYSFSVKLVKTSAIPLW